MLSVLPLHGSHELVQLHNILACYLLLRVIKKTTTKVSVRSKSHCNLVIPINSKSSLITSMYLHKLPSILHPMQNCQKTEPTTYQIKLTFFNRLTWCFLACSLALMPTSQLKKHPSLNLTWQWIRVWMGCVFFFLPLDLADVDHLTGHQSSVTFLKSY